MLLLDAGVHLHVEVGLHLVLEILKGRVAVVLDGIVEGAHAQGFGVGTSEVVLGFGLQIEEREHLVLALFGTVDVVVMLDRVTCLSQLLIV